MSFNDRDYTSDAIIKQLGLIELHCKDGSAMDAGCACIDEKHLYLIEGLAEEGQGFALTDKEKQFYSRLGDFVRQTRKNMEVEEWNLPTSTFSNLTPCQKKLVACVKRGKSLAVCKASIRCIP